MFKHHTLSLNVESRFIELHYGLLVALLLASKLTAKVFTEVKKKKKKTPGNILKNLSTSLLLKQTGNQIIHQVVEKYFWFRPAEGKFELNVKVTPPFLNSKDDKCHNECSPNRVDLFRDSKEKFSAVTLVYSY